MGRLIDKPPEGTEERRRYDHELEFLGAITSGWAPLQGCEVAERNLRHLLELTTHSCPGMRFCAFDVLHEDVDTPEVRRTLCAGLYDPHPSIRVECIDLLAERDLALALPFAREVLQLGWRRLFDHTDMYPVLHACINIADPSLMVNIEALELPARDEYFEHLVGASMAACAAGVPIDEEPSLFPSG